SKTPCSRFMLHSRISSLKVDLAALASKHLKSERPEPKQQHLQVSEVKGDEGVASPFLYFTFEPQFDGMDVRSERNNIQTEKSPLFFLCCLSLVFICAYYWVLFVLHLFCCNS